jgi:hypothetical protein
MKVLAKIIGQGAKSTKANCASSVKYGLIIDAGSKDLLKNGLTEFYAKCGFLQKLRYFGLKRFNFEKIFKNYEKAAEKVAQKAKGDILLITERKISGNGNMIGMRFLPEGLLTGQEGRLRDKQLFAVAPIDILPDRLFSGIHPMKHAEGLTELRVTNYNGIIKLERTKSQELKQALLTTFNN